MYSRSTALNALNIIKPCLGLNPGVLYRFIVTEKNGRIVKNFTVPAHTSSGRRLRYYSIADVSLREFIDGQLRLEWPSIAGATTYILEYTHNGVPIKVRPDFKI